MFIALASYKYFITHVDCSLSCGNGYITNNDCTQCVLSDICAASSPCQNGGLCILQSPPDSYKCNCTDTLFTGDTCTGTFMFISGDCISLKFNMLVLTIGVHLCIYPCILSSTFCVV